MMKNLILSETLKKVAISLLLFIGLSVSSFAQTKTITGTVVDEKGEAQPYVSVFVQGTKIGAYTDTKGNYTLNNVPDKAVLTVSSIGYVTQTITVGERSIINITLAEEASTLEEAVVTAEFGLKRVARSVGSSVQNIKAEEIIESGRDNFITALQSRVAGISVTSSAGLPGSSTNIVLRSVTSISGSNQPLYVIDGVPMNNSTFDPTGFAGDETLASRYLDYATQGNDFNPDDIESMSILKGAAAAALYGSDASNGAIVITTKKGNKGKGKVTYSYSNRFDKAYGYPEIQTSRTNGGYGATWNYYINHFGGKVPTDMKLYDNFAALLQTGHTSIHSFSIDGGTDKITIRGSGKLTNQTGVVKTTEYNKLNLSIAGKAEVTTWMTMEASMSYAETDNTKVQRGTNGPMYRTLVWPNMDDMSKWLNDDGMHQQLPEHYYDEDLSNPLFLIHKNKFYDENKSFTASFSLRIVPIENWYIIAKAGWNANFYDYETSVHPYAVDYQNGTGHYNILHGISSYPTLTILTGYNYKAGNFDFGAQFGYTQTERATKELSSSGHDYAMLDFISLQNCDQDDIDSKTNNRKKRNQGLFGQLEASYKDMVFLTLRGRNDWSSTLPKQNRSYFYPALELSFIATELSFLKENPVLSYLKLRASVAQVGKDAGPLAVEPALQNTGLYGGGFQYGYTGPNPLLKPEMTTEYEAGFEARLFNNRLNFDFSAFTRRCVDQYVTDFRLSYATGYVLNNMNVGTFDTWGWDFHVDGDIIKSKNFNWNFALNMSKAKSKVTELPENVPEYYNPYTNNSGGIRNGISVGNPITTVTGHPIDRNQNGDVIINPGSGIPRASDLWVVLGDREPKLRYSFQTTLRYKDFKLSAAFSGRWKATVVNHTKRFMMQRGLSTEAMELYDGKTVVFKGVIFDDYTYTDNPTINTIAVDFGLYASSTYVGTDEDWVETGVNYLRMDEIRLTYNVPRKWLQKVFKGVVSAASIYVAGNDVLTITNYSGLDAVGNTASAALGGTGGVGFDSFSVPSPRAISFGVSLTF
ncbi:MAG: SusC/RagA family TonB-linked outer membrane protein [Prevotellaceae bacterium]|jgi:TonB-linked SusC/RagA family outer membrane protein|nr:SusC/RagA family TonB-linked outer membrane protein [Prevotellaceae bacterium]